MVWSFRTAPKGSAFSLRDKRIFHISRVIFGRTVHEAKRVVDARFKAGGLEHFVPVHRPGLFKEAPNPLGLLHRDNYKELSEVSPLGLALFGTLVSVVGFKFSYKLRLALHKMRRLGVFIFQKKS